MDIKREVKESPITQGKNETVYYQLTTTPWGGTPTQPIVTIYDVTNGGYTQLTSEQMNVVMPVNTPGIVGDVITLSGLTSLTPGKWYRIQIKFTSGGNVKEAFCVVKAEN